jgi:hypothetical protein
MTLPGAIAAASLLGHGHLCWILGRIEIGQDGMRVGRWLAESYEWSDVIAFRTGYSAIAESRGFDVEVAVVTMVTSTGAVDLAPLKGRKSLRYRARRIHDERLAFLAAVLALVKPRLAETLRPETEIAAQAGGDS